MMIANLPIFTANLSQCEICVSCVLLMDEVFVPALTEVQLKGVVLPPPIYVLQCRSAACRCLFVVGPEVGNRLLLSGWLVLYRGGGGSEDGWVGLSEFSLILGKMQVPPPPPPHPLRGGVSFSGWVGRLLSLVDHQRCSWAEAHCDTWGCCHFVQTCFALQFCRGHSKAGDYNVHMN